MRWMLLVVLVGCAHVEMTSFDVRAHTFTLCGNRWAGDGDFQSVSYASCSTTPLLLGCGQRRIATLASTMGNDVLATPVYGTCCAYECR